MGSVAATQRPGDGSFLVLAAGDADPLWNPPQLVEGYADHPSVMAASDRRAGFIEEPADGDADGAGIDIGLAVPTAHEAAFEHHGIFGETGDAVDDFGAGPDQLELPDQRRLRQ